MMATTTTIASAYATTSSSSLHSPSAERSGASTLSTSSSASTSSPYSQAEDRIAQYQSLRSELKLREILEWDHDRRDMQRQASQERQGHSPSPPAIAMPSAASTPMLTSLSADARMNGGSSETSKPSQMKHRNETGSVGGKSSVGAPMNGSAVHQGGTSTPKRQIASPGQDSFEAHLADASPHKATAPRASAAKRVAPPLYTSRSSPLLDRYASTVDVKGHAAASPASSLQRQRSLRQNLERQSQLAAPPTQPRTEAGFTIVPSVTIRQPTVGTHDHHTILDSSHLATMHRQRSAGSSFDAKVVILGTQGVGKTSLVHRYTSGQFSSASMPSTIGASFLTKKLVLDGVRVRLQLWDTAGQERFRSMAPMYYRGANAALIVYDITNPTSFDDVKSWIDELRENVHSDLIIHVVGAKADLAPTHRHVDLDQARHKLALWTRPQPPPSPPQPETQLRTQSSFFGSRRVESTSPPSPSRPRQSLPPASMSTSRLLDFGALVGMRSKSTEPRGSPASEPSTGGNSAHDGAQHAHDPHAIDWLPEPDAWDYIDVTEVSAKDNDGVEDVFSAIATRLVERKEQLEAEAKERKLRQRQSIFLDEHTSSQETSPARPETQYSFCCTIA